MDKTTWSFLETTDYTNLECFIAINGELTESQIDSLITDDTV